MEQIEINRDLVIREMKRKETNEFRELALSVIGVYYDDIDESFADNIIRAHEKGFDPLGYFTRKKMVWVLERKGETLGYLVATEKRGKSVKFLPQFTKDPYRHKGFGSIMWLALERKYRDMGFRKVYNHLPANRFDLLEYVLKLGLKVEAHLSEQYRPGQDEFVVGKFLRPHNSKQIIIQDIPKQIHGTFSIEIKELKDTDPKEFSAFLLERLPRYYDEIDQSFVDSILAAEDRFDMSYMAKGKKTFIIENGGEIVGFCVTVPKRGGAVKISPFTVEHRFLSDTLARKIVGHIIEFYREKGISIRKLYSLIPYSENILVENLKSVGFAVEGLIREPYKPGVDNIFLGRLV